MRRRSVLVGVVAAGALLTAARGGAGADTSIEYAVKAAYLAKFAPFITWPDSAFAGPASPVVICLQGEDVFGGKLEQAAAAEKSGERAITVRHVAAPDPSCHLLFLSDPAAAEGAAESLRGKPVVTVTDSGLRARGVISFVITDNHVRFDIDDAAASQGGLAISSKLLSLAHAVRRRAQP